MWESRLDLCRDRGEGLASDVDPASREPGSLADKARRLRIVIVSEVRFRREILAEFLERDASVLVVGLCADLAEVVTLGPPLQADVVLVDAELRDGVAAARRTRQIKPDIRLIAYAVRETKEDVIAWAEAGVIGYVPNTAPSADLVRLIVNIHGGQQLCSGRGCRAAPPDRRHRESRHRPQPAISGGPAHQARTGDRRVDRDGAQRQGNRPTAEHQSRDSEAACP